MDSIKMWASSVYEITVTDDDGNVLRFTRKYDHPKWKRPIVFVPLMAKDYFMFRQSGFSRLGSIERAFYTARERTQIARIYREP